MFSLKIPVSIDTLSAVKSELTRSIPEIKSVHRCEAMARALGFRTYASARALAKLESTRSAEVRGSLFSAYLAEHGFNVASKSIYDAVANVALREVSLSAPKLTVWGIGVGQPRRLNGRRETVAELNARFQKERAALVSDASVKPFLAALALLAKFTPAKTIRRAAGSYRIKHIAENYACQYPDGESLGPVYVPNGVLIAAAMHAGFQVKTYRDEMGYDSVNTSFNMFASELDRLDVEIRPNSGRAQDIMRRVQMKRDRQWPILGSGLISVNTP